MSPTTSAPVLITEPDRLEALCDELSGEEFYAVDTEFHTERTYWPTLALIQLGWADQVVLVDPLAVDPGPLRQVFSGPGTAVAHAAGQDLDVLRAACGAAPPPCSTPRSPPASSGCPRRPWPGWSNRSSGSSCPRRTSCPTGCTDPCRPPS